MFIEKKRTKFFALPICFTTYTITEEKVNIKKGFFTIVEDDCYMYKIQDVRLIRSAVERIFGLGTVVCFTGDVTDNELRLTHIKKSREIKDFLMEKSEEARIKRRTLHTLDINANGEFDDLN